MNPKTWVEAILELVWRIGLRIVLWAALGYFLFRVRSVMVAIILAAILTYAILPVVDFLCAYQVRGISRKFQRVIATLLVFIVLGSIIVSLSVALFNPFQVELKGMLERVDDYSKAAKNMVGKAENWYADLHPDLKRFIQTQRFEKIVEKIGDWGGVVVNSTLDLVSHLVDVILIPVLAFYFILDTRTLKREFVGIVPKRRTREALAIIHEMNSIMRRYVIGQIILCVIAGVVVGLMLNALDMQYVLILSVFAGVTRAIPIIGPVISGLAIVILGMTKAPIVGMYLLVFFAILQFSESKFIMPKLIGDRMQLHPAVVIIVLLIGAEFFGIFGMFMAAPVAALIRVLMRYYLIKPKELRVWGLSHQACEEAKIIPAAADRQ